MVAVDLGASSSQARDLLGSGAILIGSLPASVPSHARRCLTLLQCLCTRHGGIAMQLATLSQNQPASLLSSHILTNLERPLCLGSLDAPLYPAR